ncbi:MAG: DUF2272 domain-containing protein [Pseudomonadota bacterium]
MTSIIPKLVSVCTDEWDFFEHSVIRLDGTSRVGKKEYEDGAWQRIGDYWKFIGNGYQNLTGKDRGTAWSAAFISWCMHEAGAEDRFPYSAGHAKYINQAIKNSQKAIANAPLLGHGLQGYKLKVGDLVGYWRGDTAITFDNARKVGWYESHTDIVVEIGEGVAYTIGGNVMHSVTKRALELGPAGELIDPRENWFVAIENKM